MGEFAAIRAAFPPCPAWHFTRLNGDKFPGTGFGLAIVQKGVEHMGGRVGVESAVGKGARFWFELQKA